jgi:predicted nucleic acid-binding protein
MTATLFVDTNVFVYAVDPRVAGKQRRAAALLRAVCANCRCVVSTQVLQEYYAAVTRKLDPPMPSDAAARSTRQLTALDVRAVDARTVLAAIERVGSRSISIWDSLIVQSAVESGCTVLLTEDLTHGEVIDGVRVVDPFRGDEDEVLALFG